MSLRKTSAEIRQQGRILKTYRVEVSKGPEFTLTRRDYRDAESAVQAGGVAALGEVDDKRLWWTPEGFYWSDEDLDAESVALLVWDRSRKHTAKIERLRKIRAREEDLERSRRERIPHATRLFVWQRDEGRCVQCGADEDLQFDHVIPVAKGGSNSEENLQILCGPCNRQKSDSI